MIANIIFTLIGLSLMCVACWWMGYKTCESRSKYEYDRGYNQALKDREEEELRERDEMLDQIYREDKAWEVLGQVEELFEDNTIDCGEY